MALTNKITTAISKQDWIVEFYPFSDPDPINGASVDVSLPIGIGAADSSDLAIVKKTLNDTGVYTGDDNLFLQRGLVSLSLSRTKGSPENPLQMTFVGKMTVPTAVGTWIVVSTISSDSQPKHLTRFLGQIHTVSVSYTTQPSGLVTQVTTISARSWSSMLAMPVRFDIFAIANSADKSLVGSPAQLVAAGKVTAGKGPGAFAIEDLIKVVETNFNAFEFAHLILKLVGCLSKSDSVTKVENLGVEGFPLIALTMPSVPKSLLKRLGLPDLDPENPFQSQSEQGLVNVITGVLTSPFRNEGGWDGVFLESSKTSSSGIEDYKSQHNKAPQVRPIAAGGAGLLGIGHKSAWELLTQYADPSLHEVVADILYEKLSNGSIVARPVIFVRDHPFLLKTIVNNPVKYGIKDKHVELMKKNWSFFDDVPRVRISSAHIIALSSRNTLYNSPNLMRFNFHRPTAAADFDGVLSSLNPVRLPNHMRRWGGQEHFIETEFYPISSDKTEPDQKIEMVEWSETTKALCAAWHCFNYKMADMTISMRDDASAITVGLNVQFSFGPNEFVGHVESVNINFQVLPNGIEETDVSISLSRVMLATESGLEFIPIDQLASLTSLLVPDTSGSVPGLSIPSLGIKL